MNRAAPEYAGRQRRQFADKGQNVGQSLALMSRPSRSCHKSPPSYSVISREPLGRRRPAIRDKLDFAMELLLILSAFVCAVLSTGIVDWRIILPPDSAARTPLALLALAVALLLLSFAF